MSKIASITFAAAFALAGSQAAFAQDSMSKGGMTKDGMTKDGMTKDGMTNVFRHGIRTPYSG
jgi:pentapeptide MXKDX repeat protein